MFDIFMDKIKLKKTRLKLKKFFYQILQPSYT